ncbi:VIR protein [Plasmodium vivax]|uniref:VIR protein n=1 Tax=Plasmodium vivax TaxID=5855 RepID=A0A1G4EJ63_PLAVI|nr:VIR protein [Plasmodium vivax]
MYDKFADTLNDEYNMQYSDACDGVQLNKGDRVKKQKNTCKALLRNSLLLYDRKYESDVLIKYCDILYIWMYFEIKNNMLSSSLIDQIFRGSIKKVSGNAQIKHCPYFSYSENLHEPEKLMKLSIFNDNIETLKKILNNINDSNNCSCLEYVYECINIYNDMNNRFCATPEDKNTTNKDTCDKLNNFNSNYSSYIRNVKGEIYELPFLSDTTTATTTHTLTGSHATRRLLNKEKLELGSGAVHQSSSPKQISISTALSTMFGIPPFLALIYKFTPVGTWLRSKYRKDADVFKNVDDEKEIYSPRYENSIMNFSQERYNVSYEKT